MSLKCEKCFRTLNDCQVCHGKTRNLCRTCNNTGMVCSDHGGYWKK